MDTVAYVQKNTETVKSRNHYSDFNSERKIERSREYFVVVHCKSVNISDVICIKNPYSLTIDDESFVFNKELDSIKEAIEASRLILELDDSWDNDNAMKISREIWVATAKFLARYSKFLFNIYSVVIETPEINPCPNNSIDLSWRTRKSRLLINIREENDEISAFYYGDFYNKKNPIKGAIPVIEIESFFANWMQNLGR